MHYKDGTPALIGDIVQHDDGSVGILLGGQIGNDYCSSHVLSFRSPKSWSPNGPGYIGTLKDVDGKTLTRAAVAIAFSDSTQTRELTKIGHIDLS